MTTVHLIFISIFNIIFLACGKKRIDSNLQLKINGQVINHSNYPWVAAVYYNEGPTVENSLRCLGTIISRKLVATGE